MRLPIPPFPLFCLACALPLPSQAQVKVQSQDQPEAQEPVQAPAAAPPQTLADELRSGFYSRFNVLGFGLYQDVRTSTLNPGNSLGLARNQGELDFRPDFSMKLRQFEFGAKPRLQYAKSNTIAGTNAGLGSPGAGVDDGWHTFLNEGYVRYHLNDELLLSYGRENLQWGPSALLSPSNPFYASNGRNNPNIELPGLDYTRVVYIPSPALTVSLIANTGPGRLPPGNAYQRTYAVKVDYTADGHYFSVLGSHRERSGSRVGFFGGWDVSDALLLHIEGSAGEKKASPWTTRSDRQLLAGATYTMENGAAVTGEYFYNNVGCDSGPIAQCFQQRGALIDPLRPLARRHYAQLQYADTKIFGKLNLVARLTRNLDDNSSQFILNLEYELGDHVQLYLVPTLYHGRRDSEFGALLGRTLFFGASYTF